MAPESSVNAVNHLLPPNDPSSNHLLCRGWSQAAPGYDSLQVSGGVQRAATDGSLSKLIRGPENSTQAPEMKNDV